MSDQALIEQLAGICMTRSLRVVTAESCTGGMVAAALTSIAGSSAWFDRGYVTYANRAKQDCLGVPEALIATHGAVSEQVAKVMASGAIAASGADVCIAITGIAGPDGGTQDQPVGTVWFACQMGEHLVARCEQFSGDRDAVRNAARHGAITFMLENLELSS